MQDVPLDPPWPHCQMFRAPLIPEGYETVWVFEVGPHAKLPDIWSDGYVILVSEPAKRVLEACDDFGHQFHETEIQNKQHKRINQTPYYLFHVRRYLKIEDNFSEIENRFEMFAPNYYELKYLPTLQKNPLLKEKVAQLPFWRHYMNDGIVYLSAKVLAKLQEAGLTGLKPYSDHYFGKAGEALARFE
ncbi:MAG: hypothetical protein PHU14_10090 [Methylovulum sp.]|nr:hypothetical protein [Methylovulum sp.]